MKSEFKIERGIPAPEAGPDFMVQYRLGKQAERARLKIIAGMKTGEGNHISPLERARAVDLFLGGESVRGVMAKVKIANETARRIQRRILAAIAAGEISVSCPCGGPLGHRGWCSWRYKRSPGRQAFMREWHSKSRA